MIFHVNFNGTKIMTSFSQVVTVKHEQNPSFVVQLLMDIFYDISALYIFHFYDFTVINKSIAIDHMSQCRFLVFDVILLFLIGILIVVLYLHSVNSFK